MARVRFRTTVAAVAIVVTSASTASAQYFGRNKVQYKQLDFQVLKTEHFDIYYYGAEREGIDIAARMAERWRVRLGRTLNHELKGRQPLVLYASHPDFEQTNTIQGELGEGTGGVTEPLRRRIVLPLGGPLADTDHVIGHELVHAFQFDMTTKENSRPGQNGAERLPLWFIEGMAEYLSLGPVDPNTAMWMRDAVRQSASGEKKDALPSIKDLNKPKYFPYRWGQAFWAYVGGRYGDAVIPKMLSLAAVAGDPDVAIENILKLKPEQLSSEWQASLRQTYEPVVAAAIPANEIGRLIVKSSDFAGDLNVGPALSPDGQLIAFLSTRSVFAIDLFVAETATGKILHKLTSTATNPHFSSLQFIYSAGAWDAASQRIAIATVVDGRPTLAIITARDGDTEREIPLPTLDEIFNPTWAPDGHAICFTGMSSGLTDLYLYDLAASSLRRLTTDAFADLQPSWSPDGTRIAFATDRFSTNLETLSIGDYRLALIDPSTSAITPVATFTQGKSINPQWMPDGHSLLFISDRDGLPNVYRTSLDGGGAGQVTRVATGISGITASSPALSVASRSGLAAYSVYQAGKYDIYTSEVGRGSPITTAAPAAALPPLDRRPSDVAALLNNAPLGLPAPTTYPTQAYKPKLTLEGLAQPTVAVGASRFGAAVGGGIAFQFGDMLGDHTLTTAVQIDSGVAGSFSLKNSGAQAVYLNSARRWNWGIVASQIPYLSGGFQSGLAVVGNEPAQVDQQIIFRQTEQSVGGLIAYPFNRAQRLEFQGGLTRISFDQIVQTTAFSLNTGQLLVDDSSETSLASPLALASTSAAFVSDTANFGATSPVQGQRYRIEASPTFGSIQYTNVLADYRRYFMPVPFYTLAGRVLHFGRYGSGGEDPRLQPLFLGYPNLVRGYDVGTFQAADCLPTAVSDCPALDRLIGSRLLIGNLEFRFPLLRPFGASQRMYGPVPVEVALFADGGVAWNRGESPAMFGGSRDGVASAGVAFRVNLLGFAIGEFDLARPFQKGRNGWVFQFNLSPGF